MKERIIVFGGTGNVGQVIIKKLVNNNHSVVVLTRQEKPSTDSLKFVIGNVLDEKLVEKIIKPSDKVIITLGFNNSSPDTMSKGTANIISAMEKNGAKRLICLSAQGAGDSWDYMPEDFKKMVSDDEILAASFKDHSIQEDFVRHSNLDWTIVRPTEIIPGEEGSTFTINRPTDKSKFKISNSDVAQFIVTELTDDKFIRQVVMITD
ncbi:MAG: NAD(P)H-binding protein [Chitinophagaceae bacterium]|nr:NAD(P)H-binding protein [Chitinophagaceae bacterium]